jgi:O-antigen ligase
MSERLSAAGRHAAIWTAAVLAIPLVCATAAFPEFQAACVASLILPALLALSGFRLDGLVIAFLVCESLVHLLKRAIFLFGPQPQAVYFGIQVFPTVILAVLVAIAFRLRRQVRVPSSGRLLAAFFALGVVETLMSLTSLPWVAVLATIQQQLFPILMFFVGLLVTLGNFPRIGRTMAWLAAISVIYGLIQLAGGPTALDRAWASQTYSYSIQGGKVFAYLEGASPVLRAFSYYADPLTWGLFLTACFLGAAVSRALGKISKVCWIAVVLLVLAGLFCSLTRTSWAGFAVMAGVYLALRWRCFRRPWLAFCLVAGAFWGVVGGGEFLYQEVFLARRLPVLGNAIADRYLTVGTVEARISAFKDLKDAALQASLIGRGFGLTSTASKSLGAAETTGPTFSHNMLVELLANTGWLGIVLFVCFYVQWLREAFALLRSEGRAARRAYRWIIGFSVGSLITGYLNGLSFMTYEFFLLLGFASGQAAEMRRARLSRSVRRLVLSRPVCAAGFAARVDLEAMQSG